MHVALTSTKITRSVHNFAHVTTAQLSWHVQNSYLIAPQALKSEINNFSRDFYYKVINYLRNEFWRTASEVFWTPNNKSTPILRHRLAVTTLRFQYLSMGSSRDPAFWQRKYFIPWNIISFLKRELTMIHGQMENVNKENEMIKLFFDLRPTESLNTLQQLSS